MTGAEAVLATAAAAGVEVCFANPGTTEMGLVAALGRVRGVRPVLGLFEGVCSGAADGYARMARRPALTLLHLGPGLGNAIANLHNARRARSPVVNLVGDHATWHRAADAPLASDIASLARAVSRWVRETRSAAEAAQDAAEAIAAAREPPGGVATLVLPADCQSEETTGAAAPIEPTPPRRVPQERVEEVARALRGSKAAVVLLGGTALEERPQRAAGRIAVAAGCRLFSETFPARFERGAGLPAVERLPYFPEWVQGVLDGTDTLVLAGAREPVAFFGYPGLPSRLTPPGCNLLTLAAPEEDANGALDALADALDARRAEASAASEVAPEPVRGPLDAEAVSLTVARLQPEGAIVVDESATTGVHYFQAAAAAPRHSWLTLTGGSIGMGPPVATGAAIACPDRTVINFQGDGGAMYTPQALWTQAREGLHVVTLVCANRSYRILQVEAARAGAEAGPASLLQLEPPPIDFVALARGLGVPAVRVDTKDALHDALSRAIASPGPHLVEVPIAN